jgi:radical SAM protein with 4Fe4S-binding SPASM domain
MKRTEIFALFKYFTIRKTLNFFKLYSSFLISKTLKSSHISGMPLALSLEPTTACNLGCPECPSGLKKFTRKTGNLTTSLNKKIIDELKHNLSYINYYFQGEPYINPNFFEFISYANSKKIFCSTSTNGHFLNDSNCEKTIKSGLKRLIISIDGNDQKTYEEYRKNGEYKKVIKGTKNILKWKKKLNSQFPHVIFQFLVVKTNEHLVNEMKELTASLGVDELRIKTAQFYNFKNGNKLMPENEKYNRYVKTKSGEYKLKNKMFNHCWRMWNSAVITVNGELVPCCFDKDANYKMGNIKITSFEKVWKSKEYNTFRNQIFLDRSQIEICKNCSEGTKVWA